MSNYYRAAYIAEIAHAGQRDKSGAPYFEHPVRVSQAVEGETAKIVALLHDVIEDCPGWTLERISAAGFRIDVLNALDAITKRAGESYGAYLRRVAANDIAKAVKLADIADNTNEERLRRLPVETADRLRRKYAVATMWLSAAA